MRSTHGLIIAKADEAYVKAYALRSSRILFVQALLMGPGRMIIGAHAQVDMRCPAPEVVRSVLARALNPQRGFT